MASNSAPSRIEQRWPYTLRAVWIRSLLTAALCAVAARLLFDVSWALIIETLFIWLVMMFFFMRRVNRSVH